MRNDCNLGHHSGIFPWHFLGKAWLLCELHGGRAGSGYRYIPGAARGVMLHISLWKVMCCWEHPFLPPLLHHRLQTTYFSIAFTYLLKLPFRIDFHQHFREGAANLAVTPRMSQSYTTTPSLPQRLVPTVARGPEQPKSSPGPTSSLSPFEDAMDC